MHPGGTLIIKSNAGVDCTKAFDNLAHTNNPEGELAVLTFSKTICLA